MSALVPDRTMVRARVTPHLSRAVLVVQAVTVFCVWAWLLTAEHPGILVIGGLWTACFMVCTHPFHRILRA